jgi:hypothetical protein
VYLSFRDRSFRYSSLRWILFIIDTFFYYRQRDD